MAFVWSAVSVLHDWAIAGPFRADRPNNTGKLPWAGIGSGTEGELAGSRGKRAGAAVAISGPDDDSAEVLAADAFCLLTDAVGVIVAEKGRAFGEIGHFGHVVSVAEPAVAHELGNALVGGGGVKRFPRGEIGGCDDGPSWLHAVQPRPGIASGGAQWLRVW